LGSGSQIPEEQGIGHLKEGILTKINSKEGLKEGKEPFQNGSRNLIRNWGKLPRNLEPLGRGGQGP